LDHAAGARRNWANVRSDGHPPLTSVAVDGIAYFAGGVVWLGCADPAAIPADVATCGRGLNLHSDFTSLPLDGPATMVSQAWHNELPRLLIFDNCEDEAVLEDWLPRGGGCRVLVTARRGTWSPELGVQAVSLGILTRTESIALLRRHRRGGIGRIRAPAEAGTRAGLGHATGGWCAGAAPTGGHLHPRCEPHRR
jgi:hypothetical protein